jgi:methionyl-tRNA synthetase
MVELSFYNVRKSKRYTITAALPYTNGPIHIGHLAGVYVPADIYARYLRLQGKDVAFICGSDEHGVAISMKAKKEGITPQEVIDKYDGIIRKSFVDFGISFDNYSRTSSKIHHDTASEFFKNYMITAILLKKLPNNCMMPKPISFLQIDL